MRAQDGVLPAGLRDAETAQLERLRELVWLMASAGYQSPRIERDHYHLGEHLVEISAPGYRNTPFEVRCRPVEGSWRYEAIAGGVVTSNAAELLNALDYLFSVPKEHRVC